MVLYVKIFGEIFTIHEMMHRTHVSSVIHAERTKFSNGNPIRTSFGIRREIQIAAALNSFENEKSPGHCEREQTASSERHDCELGLGLIKQKACKRFHIATLNNWAEVGAKPHARPAIGEPHGQYSIYRLRVPVAVANLYMVDDSLRRWSRRSSIAWDLCVSTAVWIRIFIGTSVMVRGTTLLLLLQTVDFELMCFEFCVNQSLLKFDW